MIELYSNNVVAATNASVPFNTITLKKGCSTVESGTSSVNLRQNGIYLVSVNASALAQAAGDVSIQLYVNGQAQPQAFASATGTTTDIVNLSFMTLVQVCDCNCKPTVLTVMNTAQTATFDNVNLVAYKIC